MSTERSSPWCWRRSPWAAAVTPARLSAFGLVGTLLIYGLGPPVAVLVGYPRLLHVDRLAELAPKISALETSPLFAALGRANLEHLATAATDVTLPTDTLLIRQGDPADALYLIQDGTLAVSVKGADGRHHPVAELAPGDYFGEIGLLDGIPRTADVRVVEDCHLYRIDGDSFLAAAGHNPATGFPDRARHRAGQTRHIAAPVNSERRNK